MNDNLIPVQFDTPQDRVADELHEALFDAIDKVSGRLPLYAVIGTLEFVKHALMLSVE